MLTPSQVMADGQEQDSRLAALADESREGISIDDCQNRWWRVFRVEWLGQTVASLCWIGSVMAYGISSTGDWLQLLAASSWLLANLAAAVTIRAD
ncbi:MAG: hypothetical protein MK108_02155 [Mariniblastus sp.]|nr:hypothetical protein [Mariniblastus sp.]